MIDDQVSNLAQIRAKEQERYEKELQDIQRQQDEIEKFLEDKKIKEIENIKRSRLEQIRRKEEEMTAKLAIDRNYKEQLIEQDNHQKQQDLLSKQKAHEKRKQNQVSFLILSSLILLGWNSEPNCTKEKTTRRDGSTKTSRN